MDATHRSGLQVTDALASFIEKYAITMTYMAYRLGNKRRRDAYQKRKAKNRRIFEDSSHAPTRASLAESWKNYMHQSGSLRVNFKLVNG